VSPGEQRAWLGLVFTTAILLHCALRSPQTVAADGTMVPAPSEIGRHIGMLVIAWLVVMEVLRKRWRDTVKTDQRDRQIEARASGRSRGGRSLFVLALAAMLAFSPLDHLAWAKPIVISNLLMAGLIASCLLKYAVTGLSYCHDLRGA
jgi:hypothetical protein